MNEELKLTELEQSGKSWNDWNKSILQQAELLERWNKENINYEPEQARKNVETILTVISSIFK